MRRLITKEQLRERVPYHPEHAMRLARQGKFPQPIKLGDRPGARVCWDEADIDAWIDERATARTAP